VNKGALLEGLKPLLHRVDVFVCCRGVWDIAMVAVDVAFLAYDVDALQNGPGDAH